MADPMPPTATVDGFAAELGWSRFHLPPGDPYFGLPAWRGPNGTRVIAGAAGSRLLVSHPLSPEQRVALPPGPAAVAYVLAVDEHARL